MDIEEIARSVSLEEISGDIRRLSGIGFNPDTGGYHRPAFSNEESMVIQCLSDQFSDPFVVEEDSLGNVYVRLPSAKGGLKRSQPVYIGSHADSIMHSGGNYDGAAGLVAGKAALNAIHRSGEEMDHDIVLLMLRGEESSRFKKSYLGSSALFGLLGPTDLQRVDEDGTCLEAAIHRMGFDPSSIERGERILKDDPKAFLELHIEQARSLEEQGLDVGLVTSIRGAGRVKIVFEGRYDHSGATPMHMRRSATRAQVHYCHKIEKIGWDYVNAGNDFVFEPTVTTNHNGSVNTVSGKVEIIYDFRSSDSSMLDRFYQDLQENVPIYAGKNCCTGTISIESSSVPVSSLDEGIIGRSRVGAQALGLRYQDMPSGAGHDAAIFAREGVPTGMIFIPCREGRSHCPEEYASESQVHKGAMLLAYNALALAKDR
jgi:N-carbamoyl-L-amino-acid hydrolase